MEALQYLSCSAGCASRVSLLSAPRGGWLLFALGRQGLSLLRQEAEHRCRLETTRYGPQRAVDCDVNHIHVCDSAPDRDTVFSCGEYLAGVEIRSVLAEVPQVVPARRRISGCNLSCHVFKLLLEVQHPV